MLTLVAPTAVFAFQTNYSAEFKFEYDFSKEPFETFFSTDFRIAGSTFGSYDLSFSLKGTSLESAKLLLKLDNAKLVLYNNTVFGTTNDPLVLYKISDGKNGIELQYGDYKIVLFQNLDLYYLSAKLNNFFFIVGKRGSIFDVANFAAFDLSHLILTTEIVSQDIGNFSIKNAVMLFNLAEKTNNYGIRYILSGATNTSLPYSPQVLSAQNTLSAWYKFGSNPFFNTYLSTHFNFDEIMNDLEKNTKLGIDISIGAAYANFEKSGLSNIFAFAPSEWGNFLVKIGTGFSLFDFSGRVEYSFGKPIHNSINTLGEIFYGEIGKSFGNISLFGKYQKIIGYYEEKDFFYSEVKFTGFSNSEVRLHIGNGDFYGNNPFKPSGGIYFRLWW